MSSLSDAQICSKALVLLGQNPIPDINNTQNSNAVKCLAVYGAERDSLLREYNWSFAKGRAILAAATTPPVFGYQYQYQLPADCLVVRVVNRNRWPFAKEGNFILTNMDVCYLHYTKAVTETGLFDSVFADCLSIRIARALAYSILKKPGTVSAMDALLRIAISTAKRVDSIESYEPVKKGEHSSWLEGREGDFEFRGGGIRGQMPPGTPGYGTGGYDRGGYNE